MDRGYRHRMPTLAARIRRLRNAREETQVEFGDVLGTTQGTVARWESGSIPKHEALQRLARLAGVSVEEFLGSPMRGEDGTEISVVGYVGAGAAVYGFDEADEEFGIGEVERPPFVRGSAVAVEVRGDSLIPVAEDGWKLIYQGEQVLLEEEVLNRLCVVRLIDGRTLVKRVMRGTQPRRYHLASTNAPMIEDAEIVWAALVKAIIPS